MLKRIKRRWRRLIIFVAGIAAAPFSLNGATLTTPAPGTLFLGFRAAGGQGASTSYLVSIGSDLTYRNATPNTSFTVSGLGDIGADLVAAYGSNWHSREDLFWGVFGVRNTVSSTVYGSRAQSPVGTLSAPWPSLDATARNGTASAITSVLEGTGGYTGSESTANSPVATLQPNSAQASSYNKQVATQGTTDFGSLSQWGDIEDSFDSGASGTALDLYRIASTGVTRTGTFTIDTAGTLTFAAPVPEPTTTLLLGAAGLALILRRRTPSSIK